MDLVKLQKPNLPLTWDYDSSVNDTKGSIYKWKNITENIAYELWIAREMLSKTGATGHVKNLSGSFDPLRTWSQYCEDIGSSKGVVNRWLNNWFGNNNVHISNNSGENEWYTPPEFIESARCVMGSIDLDPASSELANEIIKAPTFYTKETNGLDKIWEGNVWLNPPYGQPIITEFAEAVINNINDYEQAIILVNNATETNWLQGMMKICDAICFPKSRIKFFDKSGDQSSAPLQGQVILYIGDNFEIFISEFERYGLCMVRTNRERYSMKSV